MSLKHGILGFMLYGVDNGYELNKAFERSIDNFWHATPSQIYRELDWLERNGMAESEVVVQSGKPNKKKFRITAQGREMFREWLASGAEESITIRSTFLMRVFFSGLQPGEDAVTMLAEFEQHCRAEEGMAEEWNRSIEHYRPKVGDKMQSLYWQITVDFGRRYLQMCREWSEVSREKIEEEIRKEGSKCENIGD